MTASTSFCLFKVWHSCLASASSFNTHDVDTVDSSRITQNVKNKMCMYFNLEYTLVCFSFVFYLNILILFPPTLTFEFRQRPIRYVTNNVLLHTHIFFVFIYLLNMYIILHGSADQSLIIK